MNAFEACLEETRVELDAALDRWLPTVDREGDLAAAMRHIVFAGGKRLRPALARWGAVHVGGTAGEALGAAGALELVHAYSLLHDDLPCMDDAALRRGRPCAHVVYGEATALLAGDALLTLAFEVLVENTPADRPVGELVATLARAAGWAGMVGGQVADLAAEGRPPHVSIVRSIHERKTAALIGAAFRMGALAGGAAVSEAEALERAGHDIGLAFQIVDDLLDVQGTSAELGKPAGADEAAGKMTWPAAVGVRRARADAEALLERASQTFSSGPAAEQFAGLRRMLLPGAHERAT